MFDLKSFRADHKISQYELADFLGVQQPFISQIEKGKDPMPDSWIPKLSEKYDIDKYFIDETSNINIQQKFKHSCGIIGQITGGNVDIHHDDGKDKVIEEQDKAVEHMFKTMLSEIHGFHEISKNRDEYVQRQDDYVKTQDEYISKIIRESYLRNERNMERLDKVIEQQNRLSEQHNKLVEMVIQQNERTQNRADKIVDALIQTKVNK